MSGIISLLQLISGTGILVTTIETEVVKGQIRNLINSHKEQFDLMISMNDLVSDLTNTDSLTNQLKTTKIVSVKNWNAIAANMDAKNKISKTLYHMLQEKNKTDQFDMTVLGVGKLIGQCLALVYLYGEFFTGEGGLPSLKVEAKQMMEFIKKNNPFKKNNVVIPSVNQQMGQMIREPNANQIQLVENLNVDQISQTQPQSPNSKLTKAKLAFRVLIVIGLFVAFAYGITQWAQLAQKLKGYQQYFKDFGEFQKIQEGMIELMKYLSIDIFNLLNVSRATVNDIRLILTMNSLLTTSKRDSFLSEAARYNPDQLGFNEAVIEGAKTLYEGVKDVKSKNNNRQEYIDSMNKIVNAFKTFKKSYDVRTLFNNFARILSIQIANLSLQLDFVVQNQKQFHAFNQELVAQMEKRQSKLLKIDPNNKQELKELDQYTLTNVFNNYKYRLFKLNNIGQPLPQSISDLKTSDKENIVRYIAGFTDKFYADSADGTQILNLKIADYQKDKDTISQVDNSLINQDIMSLPNASTPEAEATKRKVFEDYALTHLAQIFDATKYNSKEIYRFIRIQFNKQKIEVQGQKYDVIDTYEGLLWECKPIGAVGQNRKYAVAEKNLISSEIKCRWLAQN